MSDLTTRVWLIRHATNDWIGSGKLPGRTPGIHLNEREHKEADALAERLAGLDIAAVYSSPLERAQETAESVASRLNRQITTLDGVTEVDCGDWTGQRIEELAKTDLWRQVQTTPSIFRFPGGESMLEIQHRMVEALGSVVAKHRGEIVLVVSHADPISLCAAYHLGLPLDLFHRLAISPASITEIAFNGHGQRMLRLNDCAHVPPKPPKVEPEPERVEDPGGKGG